MAISPEYIDLLRVGISSSPEWKEAWDRINDYLDALKTPYDLDRELVLLSSFEKAIARKRDQPFTPATELAFVETQKMLDHSLGHLIGDEVPGERRSVEERVRLYLTEHIDGNVLKRRDKISPDVLQALREVKLQAAPHLQVASITPKPLEFSRAGKSFIQLAEKLSPIGANRVVVWVTGLVLLGVLVFASLHR
jgi:hypothetical protein